MFAVGSVGNGFYSWDGESYEPFPEQLPALDSDPGCAFGYYLSRDCLESDREGSSPLIFQIFKPKSAFCYPVMLMRWTFSHMPVFIF